MNKRGKWRRDQKIKKMRKSGLTYDEISDLTRVSKSLVKLISRRLGMARFRKVEIDHD